MTTMVPYFGFLNRAFSYDVMVIWKAVAVILLGYRLNGDLVCYIMPIQNTLIADGLAIHMLNRGAIIGVKKLESRE